MHRGLLLLAVVLVAVCVTTTEAGGSIGICPVVTNCSGRPCYSNQGCSPRQICCPTICGGRACTNVGPYGRR